MNCVNTTTLTLILLAPSIAIAGSPGPYVGGQVMYSSYEEDFAGFTISGESAGYKVYGGYRFGVGNVLDYFAIEASWQDIGEFDELFGGVPFFVPSNRAETDIDGFTLDVLGFLPLSDSEEFYGKVGYYDLEGDLTVDQLQAGSSGDTGLNLGAGIQSQIGWIGLRLEFTWFLLDEGSIWSLGFGAQWNFGAGQ